MIGAGGFGSVWLEKEQDGGQLRAVKMIQRHVIDSTGFSPELAALITLTDVSIRPHEIIYVLINVVLRYSHLFVQFLGWFENENEIFLAMEYIEGGDLSEYMTDHETAKSNAAEITKQILEGIQVLHEEGICHRDLKPHVWFRRRYCANADRHRTFSSLAASQFGSKLRILGRPNVLHIQLCERGAERTVILLRKYSD